MKSLYMRLAVDNMRKNGRLYMPYLLTGTCLVTVVYLLLFIGQDPAVLAMPNTALISSMLLLGVFVMTLFSVIFLLYTNSFLMKRRKLELGLYSVLGLSRKHILLIVLWETALCAAGAILFGLALGALLSKLAVLTLVRLLGGAPASGFYVDWGLMSVTAALFAGLYLLVFLRSAVSVARVRPLALMREAQAGERAPRDNALLALAGVALLAVGYALALTVTGALDAIGKFFIAVLLVIVGTSLCFRSASVFILTRLRRWKRFYYAPEHFISVSGMAYRMNRCGDSLAVICILLTMVMVMMCSSTGLFFGAENSVRRRLGREIVLRSDSESVPPYGTMDAPVREALASLGAEPENALHYRSVSVAGALEGDAVVAFKNEWNGDLNAASRLCAFTFLPLEDYNAMSGENYVLAPGEALIAGTLAPRVGERLSFFGGEEYRIAARDVPLPADTVADPDVLVGSLLVVVPEPQELLDIDARYAGQTGVMPAEIETYYAFDLSLPAEEHPAAAAAAADALRGAGFPSVSADTLFESRLSTRTMGAGLLSLGALLSLAFLCATALSMYYKQITEGIEDQARFGIMRRVGLSRRMIRRSINAQLLFVFFSPLALAAVHVACAFPMIAALLAAFGLYDTAYLVLTTLCTCAAVAAVYAAMYAVTSRVYYGIVAGLSGDER